MTNRVKISYFISGNLCLIELRKTKWLTQWLVFW